MNDLKKTKEQLLLELAELRKRISGLVISEVEYGHAREALRQSEKRFKTLFDNVGAAVFIHDIEGRFLECNRFFCERFGYSLEELLKMTLKDINTPRNIALMPERLKMLLQQRHIVFESAYVRKDGATIPVEVNNRLVDFSGNHVVLSSARDITRRKRAEQIMKESEARYRNLFENAHDMIQSISPDGHFIYVNPAWLKTMGYIWEELQELTIFDVLHPGFSSHCTELFQKAMSGESLDNIEVVFLSKDGRQINIEGNVSTRIIDGKPVACYGIFRDMTEHKRLEEQLFQAQKMEAVGQLAGGIAHDFNNLLTAIIGYGSLLKTEVSKDTLLNSYITQILNAGERAALLTNDLLTFSRKQIINPKPVNLNEIIREVRTLISRIIGEDIEISTALTDKDLMIMADSPQIEQVLMNLVANARDAMPDGGNVVIGTDVIELDSEFIKAHGYGRPGSYAVLSFEDSGTGMDEKTRERIFEPFFTTKAVGKGTGLGLSMVYGIVKQHGGYINVYSESGRGTTFRVYLPVIAKKAEEAKHGDFSSMPTGHETILLGEDDTQARNLMKDVLLKAGYEIMEAVDGDDSLRVYHEHKDRIQLLILDVIMPKKNGKEVYDEICMNTPGIKTIFVSGYSADIIHKKRILEEGLHFISKPVSPGELLTKIREVLDQ